MTIGMALMSRILVGEEPCMRKVQYSRQYELPKDARLIKHKMNHELLVSKIVTRLNGEIYVNYRVTSALKDVELVGYIDILNINSDTKTVFEIKSGKEKESHHVQLWLYMGCFDDARGILQYPGERYMYFSTDIPRNLWKLVEKRVKPLLSEKMLLPVKGSHCDYCRYKSLCKGRLYHA